MGSGRMRGRGAQRPGGRPPEDLVIAEITRSCASRFLRAAHHTASTICTTCSTIVPPATPSAPDHHHTAPAAAAASVQSAAKWASAFRDGPPDQLTLVGQGGVGWSADQPLTNVFVGWSRIGARPSYFGRSGTSWLVYQTNQPVRARHARPPCCCRLAPAPPAPPAPQHHQRHQRLSTPAAPAVPAHAGT